MIEDFKSTLKDLGDDKLLTVILEALNLSHKALLHDPTQLGAQMIGRVESNEVKTLLTGLDQLRRDSFLEYQHQKTLTTSFAEKVVITSAHVLSKAPTPVFHH